MRHGAFERALREDGRRYEGDRQAGLQASPIRSGRSDPARRVYLTAHGFVTFKGVLFRMGRDKSMVDLVGEVIAMSIEAQRLISKYIKF